MTDKKIVTIHEKPHAILGGSSAERWSVCTMAGVHMVNKDGKKNETSVYAAWGTVAHQIAEDMILEGKKEVELPDAYEVGPHVIDVEPEHISTAWAFAEPCIKLSRVCDDWGVETNVSLDWLYPDGNAPFPLFGYVDFWAYHRRSDTLYIVDLKAGKGVPVSAYQNKQMYYYALGVWHELDQVSINPANIKLTIIQPRCADEPDVYACPAQEVLDWGTEEMVPAVDAIHEGAAACSYAPGEKRCQFCTVPPACPALLDKLAEAIGKGDVENVEDMSSEDLGRLLDDLQLLAGLKKKAEAEVVERLTRQIPVPGWHMKPKRAIRKWFDGGVSGGDVERFLYSFLEDDAYAPRQVLSPAQAEKVFKAKGYELKGFENLVEKESSGYTLGRADSEADE